MCILPTLFKPDVTLVCFEGPNAHPPRVTAFHKAAPSFVTVSVARGIKSPGPKFARVTETFSPPPTLEYVLRSTVQGRS